MRLVDSRRLRGPNLQTPEAAAVAEVALSAGERPELAAVAWKKHVVRMARALGWRKYASRVVARPFPGGIAFALPAPIDLLLEATDINDWAIEEASRALSGERPGSFDDARARFQRAISRHGNPRLVALHDEARRRGVPFLWDDEAVTLGMARTSRTYSIAALPSPRRVPWGKLARIPVALVTGTNGKTTTSRLLARMVKVAGLVAGSTSTDGIAVDERIVEPGDWTGAEAARNVLRRPEVEVAILETARGGILRRGLGVDACDVAVVTNVTSDHLGEFGVCDLATMARAKAVVTTVVRRGGRAVLNADDRRLVALLPEIRATVVLFGRSHGTVTRAHLRGGGVAYVVQRGDVVRLTRTGRTVLAQVAEMPLAFGGAAAHNVANALAAAAAAWALHLPDAAVARALATFGAHARDNRGRGEHLVLANGVGVLLDFGHNAAGLRSLFGLARSLLGARGRIVMVATQPGDRTEADFAALAAEIARVRPRLTVLWESKPYMRGRGDGEVADALEGALRSAGLARTRVARAATEALAFERALASARPGDVVVAAPQIDRRAVARVLSRWR